MRRNLPQPRPIPDDVNQGLSALEAALSALEDEASLAHVIESRVGSALDLGRFVDGHGRPGGPSPGDFAPWDLYNQEVLSAAVNFSTALDGTYAKVRIAYGLAAGRVLVAAYSDEIPRISDLRWATTVDLTYAALKEAFDSVTPPSDLPASCWNVPRAHGQVRASLDELFNGADAQGPAGKIETIVSFGRVYAPDPAEDCLNAIDDFATSASMYLQDALRNTVGSPGPSADRD